MKAFANILAKIASVMNYVAMISCFFLMCLMTADVIGRFFFKSSILGSYEIAENMLVIIVTFSFADCQVRKGHIHVDILTNIFPYRIRKLVEVLVYALCCVFMFFAVRSQFLQVGAVYDSGLQSTVLRFPIWPFNLGIAIGLLVFFIAFVADFIQSAVALFSPNPDKEIKDSAMDTAT